jgi:type I restriction-modification system DNA methylase subunit
MSLTTNNGNDDVQTPDDLAEAIVKHYSPTGRVLDPCEGNGAFSRALRAAGCDVTSFDIKTGTDFFTWEPPPGRFDWIITNAPWSLFMEFLEKSLPIARNIVFLDKYNAWGTTARMNRVEAADFYFIEHCKVKQPPPPWPSMGLQLTATRIAHARPLTRCTYSNLDWTPPPRVKKTRVKIPKITGL